ncbi:hypothetical protein C442_13355 [Haloarcula amylolytica JCM 13557]|uniref:Uncharacterized protein n=2 Tax=Haloarcula amylolytica TaxID=396317 RepID=M0KE98_9EURY|nr:hypothetical protein C442_13355 [Haloarcula amylolytica JCM 13557]
MDFPGQYVQPAMSETTYQCECGAALRFRQDLTLERGGTSRAWACGDCGLPIPSVVAEKLSHQHPS